MKNFNDIEQIKAYLDGKLSESDVAEFEKQLAADGDLKKEIAAYDTLFKGFKYLNEESFSEDVKTWGNELRTKENVKQIGKKEGKIRALYRYVAVAASVLLLLGFGMNWWAGQHFSNEALANEYYSPPLNSGTMGGPDESLLKPINTFFESAHEAYSGGDYEKSLKTFNDLSRVLESNRQNLDELTYRLYSENSDWTRLMIWLKTNQTGTAEFENLLNEIAADSEHAYSEQAQKLKKNLNGFWRSLTE